MEAYCPRCQTALTTLTDEQVANGTCPTCGGQVSTSNQGNNLGVDGAVGLTFAVGTQIAAPLLGAFEQKVLTGTLDEAIARRAPSGFDVDMDDDDASATPPPPPMTYDDGAGEDTPPPSTEPGPAPQAFNFSVPSFPSVDLSAPPAMESAPVGASSENELAPPAQDPGSSDLPAHLQLPSIDFSMPSFGSPLDKPVSGSSSLADAPLSTNTNGGSELPAHLQLPSFPEFDLPPVPGQETPPATSSEPTPAHLEQPSAAPPPPPPPPRRRKTVEMPPAPDPASTLPDLPSLGGLPVLGTDAPQKEVTLLSSETAAALASAPKRRSPVGAILALLLLIGVGVGLWFGRDTIAHMLASQAAPPPVVETAEDKARAAFLAGQKAYEANKLDDAKQHFEAALAALPHYARAHRGLAITFAKMNKPAEAVDRYRSYLSLEPNAKDAADVRKIIEDYDKAKKKEPAPAATESTQATPSEPDAKAKSKKKKR